MLLDFDLTRGRRVGLRRLRQEELRGISGPWHFDGNLRDTEARDGIEVLKRMGLAMYTDNSGFYSIGFTNARHQHAHDRWLYATNSSHHWFSGGRRPEWLYLRQAHTRHDTGGVATEGNLVEDLLFIESSVRRGTTHGLSKQESLHQLQLVGPLNYELLLKVGNLRGGINYTHAHDLLYHWEAWQARHAEAADMPRDLVLRMHGLGPVLDSGIELNGYAK